MTPIFTIIHKLNKVKTGDFSYSYQRTEVTVQTPKLKSNRDRKIQRISTEIDHISRIQPTKRLKFKHNIM